MSDSIGKVQLDLETNYGDFQRQLNGVSGKATGMVSSAFAKLGGVVAGAFAVSKLIQFGKASIDLASDLAEVQNVVDVVFGESAGQINNFAKTAITSYGLSELSAKKYSSTMGAMLKSMGLSDDAVLNMSQSITALAGDMASFYNLNGDDAFNKIRSGISGETEPLKQLGINMSQANLEAFALSKGITKSVQSMTQSEQALLRYNYLLSVTSDAQGDFARTSDGWANQTRILQEQFNTLKATLGSAFIAVLAPVVKMLNWLVAKLQTAAEYFKAFVETVTGVKAETNAASSGMTAIADSATDAGDATVEAAKKASKALAGFDKLNVLSSDSGDSGSSDGSGGLAGLDVAAFESATVSLPEIDTSNAEKAAGKIKAVFGKLKSYVQTQFAPSIKAWGKAFTDLKTPVESAFNSIAKSSTSLWKDTLKPFAKQVAEEYVFPIVNSIQETLIPIFTDGLSFALSEYSKDFEFACLQTDTLVKDIFQPALELVKNKTVEALGVVKDEWAKHGESLLAALGKFKDSVKAIWDNMYQSVIKPVWDKIVSGLGGLWDEHLKPLWESLVQFFFQLGEAILVVWNNFLAPFINWVIKTLGPILVDAFGEAWDAIKKVFGNIIDAAKNIIDALKGLLDFIIGVFTGDWKKAWEGIKTFFKNLWDAIVNVVKAPINLIIGCINTMLTAITSAVNLAIKALNKLSFTVPDWVPGLGGKKWGFSITELTAPKIPYLARGGIIDQPTLAMVGERGKEAVVPLENTAFADSIANAIMRVLMPLLNSGKGVGKNSDEGTKVIVLKVGEYELGRVTVGAINKYHNVIGKVELEV